MAESEEKERKKKKKSRLRRLGEEVNRHLCTQASQMARIVKGASRVWGKIFGKKKENRSRTATSVAANSSTTEDRCASDSKG